MEMNSGDVKDIINSPMALALTLAIIMLIMLMPVKEAALSMVVELKDLNTNIEDLTKTVTRHEKLLSDLSSKVDNLTKEK